MAFVSNKTSYFIQIYYVNLVPNALNEEFKEHLDVTKDRLLINSLHFCLKLQREIKIKPESERRAGLD